MIGEHDVTSETDSTVHFFGIQYFVRHIIPFG